MLKHLLPALALVLSASALADNGTLNLINQRLSLMRDVAAYKWQLQRPVEDLAREDVVLNAAIQTSLQRGITTASSRAFFAAQITAAKDIQQCWFDRWQTSPPSGAPPDLITEIRPRLIDLGNQITTGLTEKKWRETEFLQVVSVDCLSREAAMHIFSALNNIAHYQGRYEQVIESHLLRVGTTGDYAPFSHALDGGDFQGVDIDMAKDLAKWLKVELVLVQTSWPGLTDDFLAGRFDIAMSGVSITDQRMQFAAFSAPYHVGGKTPIARCDRAARFGSLEDIDQPGVRLIVNPGGTNEKFLDRHIKQATKLLHNDNRTIFEQIISGHADLMITDSIEVTLQSARYDTLCPTMPGRFLTHQEKGYMLPNDTELLNRVNEWLAIRSEDGTLSRAFTTHLSR